MSAWLFAAVTGCVVVVWWLFAQVIGELIAWLQRRQDEAFDRHSEEALAAANPLCHCDDCGFTAEDG